MLTEPCKKVYNKNLRIYFLKYLARQNLIPCSRQGGVYR
jgi:hypothetical protein